MLRKHARQDRVRGETGHPVIRKGPKIFRWKQEANASIRIINACRHRRALSSTRTMRRPTIGVFDSGFGGLTVLKALLELVPGAEYAYFGDTARLPYGSTSVATVARYAVDAAGFL